MVLDADLDTGIGLKVVTDEDADFGEVRYLQNWRPVKLTGGVGYYTGDRMETRTFGPFPFPPEKTHTRHANEYVYADINTLKRVTVTAGLSHDAFRDGTLERTPVNPKWG